jgi:hypothetical protein
MADERLEVALPDLGRWLAVAALIVGGIVLFLWLAPSTDRVIEPVPAEAAQ